MSASTAKANDDFNKISFREGKYCGACHNSTIAFDLKADCTKCHVDTPEYKRAISGAGDSVR